MFRVRTVILVAIAALSFQAMASDLSLPPRVKKLHGAASRQDFLKKHPVAYSASEARAQEILAGVDRIRHCMSHRDVKKLLGSPDYGTITSPHGDASGKYWGVLWYYWLHKPLGDADPDPERAVLIFFDDRGSAYSTTSPGIENIDHLFGSKVSCKS